MPNLNIPVDLSLLRDINVAATKADLTQRDWVIKVLAEAANGNQPSKFTDRVGMDKQRRANDHREHLASAVEAASDLPQMGQSGEAWSHNPKTCRLYGCLMCAEAKK